MPDTPTLVVEVLAFLADDHERLGRFLASSGLDVTDLRRMASTQAFAESLLDHLCSDEPLLVAFAETKDYDPASIERARQAVAPPPFEGWVPVGLCRNCGAALPSPVVLKIKTLMRAMKTERQPRKK